MKIYTGGGDKGKTSLFSGERVPKHHLRIEAYSDSKFAGDKEDRKSDGGFATYVGG